MRFNYVHRISLVLSSYFRETNVKEEKLTSVKYLKVLLIFLGLVAVTALVLCILIIYDQRLEQYFCVCYGQN